MSSILVTGGAGFIGSFLVDQLVADGHTVRIFDNLEPRIHGGKKPAYLNSQAEFVQGDVRNRDEFAAALKDIDVVFHEAALVGIEPSYTEAKAFVDVNIGGTANLYDCIVNDKLPIKKVVVPSSVGIYGGGTYFCNKCNSRVGDYRDPANFKNKNWENQCTECDGAVQAVLLKESDRPVLKNPYCQTKYDQEVFSLAMGTKFNIPTVALRYFNVYGPRQSIINPYSGVITKFIDLALQGKPLKAFEDGKQTRDFVNVKDIVSANIAAMNTDKGDYHVFNVGGSKPLSIAEIGESIITATGSNSTVDITQEFRDGDVRHSTADISLISEKLGWKPEVDFAEGLKEIIAYQKSL